MSRVHRIALGVLLAAVAPSTLNTQVPTDLQRQMRDRDRAAALKDVATCDRLTADSWRVVAAQDTTAKK